MTNRSLTELRRDCASFAALGGYQDALNQAAAALAVIANNSTNPAIKQFATDEFRRARLAAKNSE